MTAGLMPLKQSLLALAALISAGAVSADSGWLYYGGDQGGRHYSTAATIDRENVADLDVAWVHRSGDAGRRNQPVNHWCTARRSIA